MCSIAEGVPFDVSGWGTKTGAKATTAQRQPSRTTTYTVQSTPKIVIEQLKDQYISFGGTIMCKELTLNSKNYNGITMEYPLIINASMTNTQICEALKKSFGCEVRTGTR